MSSHKTIASLACSSSCRQHQGDGFSEFTILSSCGGSCNNHRSRQRSGEQLGSSASSLTLQQPRHDPASSSTEVDVGTYLEVRLLDPTSSAVVVVENREGTTHHHHRWLWFVCIVCDVAKSGVSNANVNIVPKYEDDRSIRNQNEASSSGWLLRVMFDDATERWMRLSPESEWLHWRRVPMRASTIDAVCKISSFNKLLLSSLSSSSSSSSSTEVFGVVKTLIVNSCGEEAAAVHHTPRARQQQQATSRPVTQKKIAGGEGSEAQQQNMKGRAILLGKKKWYKFVKAAGSVLDSVVDPVEVPMAYGVERNDKSFPKYEKAMETAKDLIMSAMMNVDSSDAKWMRIFIKMCECSSFTSLRDSVRSAGRAVEATITCESKKMEERGVKTTQTTEHDARPSLFPDTLTIEERQTQRLLVGAEQQPEKLGTLPFYGDLGHLESQLLQSQQRQDCLGVGTLQDLRRTNNGEYYLMRDSLYYHRQQQAADYWQLCEQHWYREQQWCVPNCKPEEIVFSTREVPLSSPPPTSYIASRALPQAHWSIRDKFGSLSPLTQHNSRTPWLLLDNSLRKRARGQNKNEEVFDSTTAGSVAKRSKEKVNEKYSHESNWLDNP